MDVYLQALNSLKDVVDSELFFTTSVTARSGYDYLCRVFETNSTVNVVIPTSRNAFINDLPSRSGLPIYVFSAPE